MSYVDPDYKTKKSFKEAVQHGVQHRSYNPSGMFPTPQHGTDVIEGPHYPRPHRWCASVQVKNGIVVKVTA